jgi:hypothetical protein
MNASSLRRLGSSEIPLLRYSFADRPLFPIHEPASEDAAHRQFEDANSFSVSLPDYQQPASDMALSRPQRAVAIGMVSAYVDHSGRIVRPYGIVMTGRYEVFRPEAEFEPGSRGRALRNRLGITSVRALERRESEALLAGSERRVHPANSTGVVAAGCVRRGIVATREALWGARRTWPLNGGSARIGPGLIGWRMGSYDQRGRCNAGGGKGPWFKVNARRGEGPRRLDQ